MSSSKKTRLVLPTPFSALYVCNFKVHTSLPRNILFVCIYPLVDCGYHYSSLNILCLTECLDHDKRWITTCQIQVAFQSLFYLTTNAVACHPFTNFCPPYPSTEDCFSVLFIANILGMCFLDSVHNPLLFCMDTVPEQTHFLLSVSLHRRDNDVYISFPSQTSLLKSTSTLHILATFI